MKTIAMISTKGGCGKTTAVISLSVRASQEARNNKVTVVDLDGNQSLSNWMSRRNHTDNPEFFAGAASAEDAHEALMLNSAFDWCFMDGPPAFINRLEDIIGVADVCIIPCKPSLLDIDGIDNAIALCRHANRAHFLLLSDVVGSDKRINKQARVTLEKDLKLPVLKGELPHLGSFIECIPVGKSAAELNNGRDKKAIEAIDKVWAELKTATNSAAKKRARVATHG